MARIRTIKPSFFRHLDLYLLEQSSGLPIRVAFAGMWTVADREGRFRWHPEELKLDCLPYDNVRFADVMNALERGGFIRRYEASGKEYGVIPTWAEHQKIGNREAQSAIPAPDLVITKHAQGEGKGREKEQEGEGTICADAPADGPRGAFERRADDRADVAAPILLLYPTVGDETGWRLRQAQVDEWATAYPNVDVMAECRRALAWVKANPGRRKTARGMPKFINAWLARSVDSGRGYAAREELPAKRECPHTPKCHSPVWCEVVTAREQGVA